MVSHLPYHIFFSLNKKNIKSRMTEYNNFDLIITRNLFRTIEWCNIVIFSKNTNPEKFFISYATIYRFCTVHSVARYSVTSILVQLLRYFVPREPIFWSLSDWVTEWRSESNLFLCRSVKTVLELATCKSFMESV